VGGDKGFDTFGFVQECRNLRVTPHAAQNLGRCGVLVQPEMEKKRCPLV
jgi:hypothetical protein